MSSFFQVAKGTWIQLQCGAFRHTLFTSRSSIPRALHPIKEYYAVYLAARIKESRYCCK